MNFIKIIEQTFDLLTLNALEQPQTLVHRDYHSRNLMLTEANNPGILDFQDAVIGPVTYDLVSLLEDARRDVEPDLWLDEGQTISMAGYDFDIFHCPGHSPGSLVYVQRENNFALVGDVLFQGSIGRTDFEYGDHDALINAIKTKLLPLGDDIAFICGHGAPSSFGQERQMNPFLQ